KVDVSQGEGMVCPMASVTKELPSSITARIGASRSISFPTLNNLYSRSSGNPDLEPEVTWKYELSIEQFRAFSTHRYLNPEIAVFYNDIRNQIDKSAWTGIYRNLLGINTWGVETTLGWGANRWLSGSVAFGWLDWSTESPIILETPHYKISSRLNCKLPLGTRINLEFSWFSKRQAEVMSNYYEYLPDYFVAHGNITQPISSWVDVRVEARNIFDANYEEEYGYPCEGRVILGGFNLNFQRAVK
ncbi:hypothetical protein AMJ86_02385, partial [bacterium SM23_57]